ncbi:MAG: nascent polypeptide-associated complex protein [Candidatus Thermoplasmatota archaeon]|nr:nascent polypeptide-associated complex protein [Candidatus Thermoplasmatota archaeon]
MNSREVKRMMAQMGIKSTDLTDVKRVIMEGEGRNIIITEAGVTQIDARGETSFQVTGKVTIAQKSTEKNEEPVLNQEDITIIMEQAHVSRESAIDALKKANGEVAQAIVDLMEK